MKKYAHIAAIFGLTGLISGELFAQETTDSEEVTESVVLEEDLELEDADTGRVQTVLITQEKIAKIGGAAHRMTEEELKRGDYSNPEAVAQQIPGVFVRGEDGFGLRPNIGIRGANSDRSKKVALMEDGILFGPAPYSAPAAYFFPQISRMAGVEIYKGPGAIQFGPNTIGGALNLITRPIPNDFSGELDLQMGQYYTGRAHGWLGHSTEWGGFVVEGIHMQSDGFKELDGGGDTGFDRQEIMLKGSVNTDLAKENFHRLTAKIGWSREHSDETYLGLSAEDYAKNPLRRYRASALDEMEWVRAQLGLTHEFEMGEAISVKTSLYRHDMRRDWFKLNHMGEGTSIFDILNDPTGRRQVLYDVLTGQSDSLDPSEYLYLGNNDRTYVSQGIQSVGKWRSEGQGWANVLEVGGRLHYDSIRRLHTEGSYRMDSGNLVAEGEVGVVTRNVGETYALAAHALDQFSFWRITVAPGARLEAYEQRLDDQLRDQDLTTLAVVLVPGVGVNVSIVEHLSVLGGVHMGFSPTAPGQDANVDPETSTNYEAGIRYSDARKYRLVEVVGFYNNYENLLGECTFSSGCSTANLDTQFNAGAVDVWGLEAAAHWKFDLGEQISIPVKAAYTLVKSEFQTAFSAENPQYGNVEVGDALPYVPVHQGSLQVGAQIVDFEGYLTGAYVASMREEAGQGEGGLRTDAQLLLDANLSYRFAQGWKATLRGENLTGNDALASRRPFGARPVRPRLVMAGLNYSF